MANMQNVLNVILSNGSSEYQSRVPQATRDNLSAVGSGIMSHKSTENEFLNALVNKVAMQEVHHKIFRNPLAVLKGNKMPLGRDIEEIYTNPATGTVYDPSGLDLLNTVNPDVKTIYHTMNRQGKYKVTIRKAQLIGAFTSWEKLEELYNIIVNTLYSGDNIEEYILMKNLLAEGIKGGKIKTVNVAKTSDTDTAKAFVKAIKTIGQDMIFPSEKYNTYYDVNKEKDPKPAVTWTPMNNQILLLRNDVSVDVDVELLAKAFNVSYTDLKQRTIIVDNFGTATNCGAILCDEAFIKVRDTLTQMENFHNGEGLYDNFIWHHWQSYSLSIFCNAMAFMFDEETDETTVEETA